MRVRCRLGIHEWAHLGYAPYRDTSCGYTTNHYRIHRYCTECGKRRQSGLKNGTPPDLTRFTDGTYVDHSRPKGTP